MSSSSSSFHQCCLYTCPQRGGVKTQLSESRVGKRRAHRVEQVSRLGREVRAGSMQHKPIEQAHIPGVHRRRQRPRYLLRRRRPLPQLLGAVDSELQQVFLVGAADKFGRPVIEGDLVERDEGGVCVGGQREIDRLVVPQTLPVPARKKPSEPPVPPGSAVSSRQRLWVSGPKGAGSWVRG